MNFDLSFTLRAELYEVAENYFFSVTGEILSCDESDVETVARRIHLYYVGLERAVSDRYDPHDLFDHDAEIYPYYGALYDHKTLDFNQKVRRLYDDDVYGVNLLTLNRIQILPEFRGSGLRLAFLYRCIQQIGHGCGLLALM